MAIEIFYEHKSGRWKITYKRNIWVTLAVLFLSAGLATLTTPWWLPILSSFFGELGVQIGPSVNYWISVSLFLAGLLCGAFAYHLGRRNRRVALDKETIIKSPLAVQELQSYFLQLVNDHSYWSSADTHFHYAYTQFGSASCALQDPKKMAKLFKAFRRMRRNCIVSWGTIFSFSRIIRTMRQTRGTAWLQSSRQTEASKFLTSRLRKSTKSSRESSTSLLSAPGPLTKNSFAALRGSATFRSLKIDLFQKNLEIILY